MKKFTSKKLVQAVKDSPESRRIWLLKKFGYAAERTKRGRDYKVWQDGFHPVELNSNRMQGERLEYVHNNPVVEGIVWRPEDYIYSSACYYYCEKDCLLEIDVIN